MKNCPVCGAQMQDSDIFCTDCGMRYEPPAAPDCVPPERAQKEEAPRQEAEAPAYTQTAYAPPPPAPETAQPRPDPRRAAPEKDPYRPLGTWGYVLTLFLMGFPVIGLAFQIIWAAGGTNSINRQNLARGYLLLRCCLAVLLLLAIVVGLALMAPMLRQIAEYGLNSVYGFFGNHY